MKVDISLASMTGAVKNAGTGAYNLTCAGFGKVTALCAASCRKCLALGQSGASGVAGLIQTIWQATLPILGKCASALRSPAGLATMAITGSYLLISQADKVANKYARVLMPVVGIACAVLAGGAAAHAGLLPMPAIVRC